MDNGSGKKVAAIFASFIIGLIKGIIVVPRGCCKFYPSCSEYAHEALGRMPFFIALYKISYRLLRCNPFSKGGYDPVK